MRIARDIIFVVIPGGFAFLKRRYLAGAAFLCVWLALAESWVLHELIRPAGARAGLGGLLPAAVAALYAVSAALSAWVLARKRFCAAPGDVDGLYREAMAAFVAGDFEGAHGHLNEILKGNPLDCDCMFLKAEMALARGRKRRAKRLFRKCRDFDEEGKWAWEIQTALEKL